MNIRNFNHHTKRGFEMGNIKNHLNQRVDIYIGKKLVSIGPRKTFKASDKDIQSSPQLQGLLARKAFRKLETADGKAADTASKKDSDSKKKST